MTTPKVNTVTVSMLLFVLCSMLLLLLLKPCSVQNNVDVSMAILLSITQCDGSRDANIEGNSIVLCNL